MNRNILFAFGILALLIVAVLLTDSKNTGRRFGRKWNTRRFMRKRPTRPASGNIPVPVNPEAPQNKPQNEIQDFSSPEEVDEYWGDIYENGKSSSVFLSLLF